LSHASPPPITTRAPQEPDYQALATLWNSAFPEHPATADEIQARYSAAPGLLVPGLIVAEQGEHVVGFGTYRWSQHLDEPRVKLWIGALATEASDPVLLDGLTHALEQQALASGQTSIHAIVREDNGAQVALFQRRGYEEQMRSLGANLDTEAFDFSPYEGYEQRLSLSGMRIRTLADLERETASLDLLRERLFELYLEVERDSPDVGGSSVITLEDYRRENLTSSRTIPEAYFVAVSDTAFVGLSELLQSDAPATLDTGATVVKRAYRRRGIALALKLRAIEFARSHGARRITTGFAAHNHASVALNLKLGYIPEPSWITFHKSLTSDL
jgi:GNAT superfamily N-acetyltransferase